MTVVYLRSGGLLPSRGEIGMAKAPAIFFWDVLVPEYLPQFSVEILPLMSPWPWTYLGVAPSQPCTTKDHPQARERFWKPLPPGVPNLKWYPAYCQAHPSDAVPWAHHPVFGLHHVLSPSHAHLHY